MKRSNIAMLAAVVVVNAIVVIVAFTRPEILAVHARLFSARTWRWLQLVPLVVILSITAMSSLRRRSLASGRR